MAPKQENVTILLDFTAIEQNEFKSIYENIKFSYSLVFKQLAKEDRTNKNFLSKTVRKISQAESNEKDLLIKEFRTDKLKIDKIISNLEKENRNISEQIGSLSARAYNKE